MAHRLLVRVVVLLLAVAVAPAWAAKKPKAPVPAGEPFAISPCPDCREGAPFVAGNGSGQFFTLWSTPDSRLRGRVFDLAGGSNPVVLILAEDRVAGIGNVVAVPGGDFRVAWLWPDQIHVQRFGLSSVVSPVLVTSGPGGADDDNAWLAARPDGSLVLVWGRTFGIDQLSEVRAQLLGSDGTPLGPGVVVDNTHGRGTPVACGLPDGSVAVAWVRLPGPPESGQPPPMGLAVRRLSPGGSPDTLALQAAPPGPPTWSMGHTVACAPDGSFALAWHRGSDVFVQLLRPEPGELSGVLVPLAAKGDQADPALLAEPGRGWLAVCPRAGRSAATSSSTGQPRARGRTTRLWRGWGTGSSCSPGWRTAGPAASSSSPEWNLPPLL
jgi:hypothetical protein